MQKIAKCENVEINYLVYQTIWDIFNNKEEPYPGPSRIFRHVFDDEYNKKKIWIYEINK